MRTKRSFKNMLFSLISNILSMLIGFVSQGFFVRFLGSEYLGINGLFNNIISVLGLVEMGVGSAIIYNLYKPLAKNNKKEISALMNFYKKVYHIVAFIVIILGILILPFLKFFVGDISIDINIYIIFMLFIVDIFITYFMTYKQNILYADQKNYYITGVRIVYLIILNFIQIVMLYYTRNYYLYLIIKIVFRILESLVMIIIVNKQYPFLKNNNNKLSSKIEKDIIKKTKALFFHKIAGVIVNGTDNIIISKFFGIVTVGLYSNYFLIINSVQTLLNQFITSLTASVGNLLAMNKEKNKNYLIYKRINFLNFYMTTLCAVMIATIIDSFIVIWIGQEYLLPNVVLIVLVIKFYTRSMRNSFIVFKEGAGIYYEDRFIPLIESLVNIFASIFLLKMFGLSGVFLGTITSEFVLWFYSYPKFVYKKIFQRDYVKYMNELIGYFSFFLIILFVSIYINNFILCRNEFVYFFKNIMIGFLVPNIIMLFAFWKSEEFKFYVRYIKKIFKTKKN